MDASPVTLTLPDPGGRFMSMIAIDEEQYALQSVYAPGKFTYTRDKVGTCYLMLGLGTFVDPNDPKNVDKTHVLQDAVKVDQKSTGTFQAPKFEISPCRKYVISGARHSAGRPRPPLEKRRRRQRAKRGRARNERYGCIPHDLGHLRPAAL
jgi:hypothetical protein